MTLALVVLVVFLAVWFLDSAKKKQDKQAHKKRTITNVKRQDEIWCMNFTKVYSDLEEIYKSKSLDESTILSAIESLFDKYDIPDTRTNEEKIASTKNYLTQYRESHATVDRIYEEDCTFARILKESPPEKKAILLKDLIWYYPCVSPLLNKPELLIGTPYTSSTVENVTYKYDAYGRATNMWRTEPALLIVRLCNLLTIKALDTEKLNYSWDRQESSWQQSEQRIKNYDENKKRYPWLYR